MEKATDVLVIAATNRPLEEDVKREDFREDLYHRLSVFVLSLPPLRDRVEDIPALIRELTVKILSERDESFCDPELGDAAGPGNGQRGEIPGKESTSRLRLPEVSGEAMAALRQHAWPGNIRELENVLIRLYAGRSWWSSAEITADEVREAIGAPVSPSPPPQLTEEDQGLLDKLTDWATRGLDAKWKENVRSLVGEFFSQALRGSEDLTRPTVEKTWLNGERLKEQLPFNNYTWKLLKGLRVRKAPKEPLLHTDSTAKRVRLSDQALDHVFGQNARTP